jgi:phosphoserine phosphatase
MTTTIKTNIVRIGYNLHGTVDAEPERFKTLFEKIRKNGDEVWIISGLPTEQVIGELQSLGF